MALRMNRDSQLYKHTNFSKFRPATVERTHNIFRLRIHSPRRSVYSSCAAPASTTHTILPQKCVSLPFSLPSSLFSPVSCTSKVWTDIHSLTTFPALAFAAPVAPEGEISKRDCVGAGCRFSATVSCGLASQQAYDGLTDHELRSPTPRRTQKVLAP